MSCPISIVLSFLLSVVVNSIENDPKMPDYFTSLHLADFFMAPTSSLAFMGLGPVEMMIVGVAAVLLFGRNLPSVARSAGKSLSEFKKGMQDLQNEVRVSIDTDTNVVASKRSTPVMPDTDDLKEEHDETDYDHGLDDTDYSERRETSSVEEETELVDTINDEDDELLNEGYPLPRNAGSGISDDSQL